MKAYFLLCFVLAVFAQPSPFILDGTIYLAEDVIDNRYDMGGSRIFYMEIVIADVVPTKPSLFVSSYEVYDDDACFGLGVGNAQILTGYRSDPIGIYDVTPSFPATNYTGVHTYGYGFNGTYMNLYYDNALVGYQTANGFNKKMPTPLIIGAGFNQFYPDFVTTGKLYSLKIWTGSNNVLTGHFDFVNQTNATTFQNLVFGSNDFLRVKNATVIPLRIGVNRYLIENSSLSIYDMTGSIPYYMDITFDNFSRAANTSMFIANGQGHGDNCFRFGYFPDEIGAAYVFGYSSGGINSDFIYKATTLPKSKRITVSFQYDGSKFYLYQNGKSLGSKTVGSNSCDTNYPLAVGAYRNEISGVIVPEDLWEWGNIYRVRIWKISTVVPPVGYFDFTNANGATAFKNQAQGATDYLYLKTN